MYMCVVFRGDCAGDVHVLVLMRDLLLYWEVNVDIVPRTFMGKCSTQYVYKLYSGVMSAFHHTFKECYMFRFD